MLRSVAKYPQGVSFSRFFPLNDDGTIHLPIAVDPAGEGALIGGAGPFDFSGVESDGAVPIYSKIDDGAVETNLVDLSAALSISAVTVDELVTALNNATITGATFSKVTATGRLKCVFASGSYHQLYGECAKIAMFGQGFGMKILKSDTVKSFQETPVNKDDNSQTNEDANGQEVEVVTPGYRKGCTLAIVDTAEDDELAALVEGGDYDDVTGDYSAPTQDSVKLKFYSEFFHNYYNKGKNFKADLAGVKKISFRNCQGMVGDKTHDITVSDTAYTVNVVSYKDPDNALWPDRVKEDLTYEEYLALDVSNV